MGFYPDPQKAVINPPKTGTNTLRLIGSGLWGLENCAGHHTYQYLHSQMKRLGRDPDQYEWAMPVREPVNRLISMLNYRYRKNGIDLDSAMERSLQGVGMLYPPHYHYWDPSAPIRLFKFEGFPIAHWLGWPKEKRLPIENKGRHIWSAEEIKEHKHFDEIMGFYEDDWDLWNRAESSLNCSS